MANEEQLAILKQGVKTWNDWRQADLARMSADFRPDLIGADLRCMDLSRAKLGHAYLWHAILSDTELHRAHLADAELMHANLRNAVLVNADLRRASLWRADLAHANLSHANLSSACLARSDLTAVNLSDASLRDARLNGASLAGANLTGVDLAGASLAGADMSGCTLTGANMLGTNLNWANMAGIDLTGTHMAGATLVGACLTRARLHRCRVHGVSAWNLDLTGASQRNLVITQYGEPEIAVDNLEVAQFIYLMLNNQKLTGVLNTIMTKVVLLLGRFTEDGRAVLDAVSEELRRMGYLPVVFTFDPLKGRDMTETVELLARMARFVIADFTDPSAVPFEIGRLISLPVPIQILVPGDGKLPWQIQEKIATGKCGLLREYRYTDVPALCSGIADVIAPAEEMAIETERRLARAREEMRGG